MFLADGDVAFSRALSVGLLVAARLAPLTVLAPWLALRGAPPVLRAALILTLTAALFPIAAASAGPLPSGVLPLGALALKEALVGAVFAVVTALPLHALDWAGRLVDSWRGASLSEVIAPPTGERTSPLGDLYLMAGVVLFALLGGHRLAFAAFGEGLVVAPVGAVDVAAGAAGLLEGAARLSASALAFATALAAPAAVAIVLVELSLGLVGRSAPQLPLFFAGMPLRAAAGLAAALLGLAVLLGELPTAFGDAIEAAAGLVGQLTG